MKNFILKLIIVITLVSNFPFTIAFSEWKRGLLGRIVSIDNFDRLVYNSSRSLVARATCPAGSYLCTDSEGGCCPTDTVCAPNYKCAESTGGGSPPPSSPPPSSPPPSSPPSSSPSSGCPVGYYSC